MSYTVVVTLTDDDGFYAIDLRGDLGTAATTLRSTGELLDAARLRYDDTDRSLLPARPTSPRAL